MIWLIFTDFINRRGIATLAVRKRRGNRFFLVSDDGMVRGWCNKATGEKIIAGEVNEELSEIGFLGIHIIDPQIFKFMNEGVYSMTSLYLQLMNHTGSTHTGMMKVTGTISEHPKTLRS